MEVHAGLAGAKLTMANGDRLETDSVLLKQAPENSYRLVMMGGLICKLQTLLSTSFTSVIITYAVFSSLRCKRKFFLRRNLANLKY